MNLSMNLQVRQSQSLTMTPQLLQSIRLLQFHHVELLAFLQREADANPLLELVPPAEAAPPVPPTEPAVPTTDPVPLSGWQDDGSAFRDGAGPEGEHHADAADRLLDTRGAGSAAPGPDAGSWEDRIGEDAPSLHAHALAEIAEVFAQGEERRLAELWFADLDASGFLDAELGLPADLLPLLVRLQDEAEPAGLFARSLEECLAIQLRRRDRFDPVMATVIANLPLLAKRDFAALSRLTGESEAELLDILGEIRALDPRPGSAFSLDAPAVVVPDAVVTREAAAPNGWRVSLNPEAFPRLRVHLERGGVSGAEERTFLAQCRQSAGWLQRSLEGRARTILKVADEIVRQQSAFLSRGGGHLKPMTLMDVAAAVGMHESTISRVTAGKYLATPRGTMEMKAFFSGAIAASDGGDAHSAESVKLRIRALVAAEGAGGVLSDDDIAARLKEEGIDLARRTVAKYREALGIASSVQRRREMKARRLAV
ncbi:RNA polymerase factor sigma-54 [Aureimonas phyllosphaerae]|uniref:RNA polymerase sigma-54 factor n=1 Tax=Aureimonas phyllosphaerae TaxID=1166078 RepID=A0A7W6BSZ5_9HYPH|nr:RNA polymerase factor sigma-54 [Aureimonas phyllosphaerae]MBB3937446.1 RNA polymerase sigma-54 factor [Aureimonas phyllosphaerae]MBB3961488.1 RNA polymerase sigma-54 factor [Aureimonas phyllosphaerae]SFF38654.1 RNA polymerase, sigma 54 subunit, RpoN/SigL [Aureimonas phyllosphaerae]